LVDLAGSVEIDGLIGSVDGFVGDSVGVVGFGDGFVDGFVGVVVGDDSAVEPAYFADSLDFEGDVDWNPSLEHEPDLVPNSAFF
jgi:hypothetical protein